MASGVSSYGYFAKMAFNVLTARLGSKPTVSITAHDYLWGYNEPLISLGNSILPGWINFDTLGVLDRVSYILCYTMFSKNKYHSLPLSVFSLFLKSGFEFCCFFFRVTIVGECICICMPYFSFLSDFKKRKFKLYVCRYIFMFVHDYLVIS